MNAITVLYDEHCPLCIRSARWLANQDTYLKLECLAAGSLEAHRRYGTALVASKKELTVVDDRGGVYRSTDAWLMCLFALVEYRERAIRFAEPALKPLARKMFETLSANRRRISAFLWSEESDLRAALEREHAAARRQGAVCDEDACDAGIVQALPL